MVEFTIGTKPVALVCKLKSSGVDLKRGAPVEIGPKLAGKDEFDKPTEAKIWVR